MAETGFPRAGALGAAVLLLLVPACSTPGLAPREPGPAPETTLHLSSAPTPAPADDPAPRRETPGPRQEAPANPAPAEDAGRAKLPPDMPWPGDGQAGQSGARAAGPDFWEAVRRDVELSEADYRNYYSAGNLGWLALGVGLAAPLANTPADMHIRRWYQRRIRGETTDEFAQVMNYAGQFWVVVPLGLEAAALCGTDPDYAFDGGWYEWSNRSLRGMAVGAPPMILMYAVLGSSRPDRNNSHWHPFQDVHGVSGHTFVGAVPFLTAAAMTDNPYYKYPLLVGSFLTGWSRINNDKHFFSQVALGWWMAWSAVHEVGKTQAGPPPVSVGPAWVGDGPGVALQVRY